jgi:hypothetical protein
MTKPKTTPAADNTYLLEFESGCDPEFLKVTVPNTWKVTYAPIFMAKSGPQYGGGNEMCLRFYEAENKQRALFRKVKQFREIHIKIERGRKRIAEEQGDGGSMGKGIRLTTQQEYIWEPVGH